MMLRHIAAKVELLFSMCVCVFFGGDCPKSQTFLRENRESAFGLVYGYGVFQSREDFSDSLGGWDIPNSKNNTDFKKIYILSNRTAHAKLINQRN